MAVAEYANNISISGPVPGDVTVADRLGECVQALASALDSLRHINGTGVPESTDKKAVVPSIGYSVNVAVSMAVALAQEAYSLRERLGASL